MRRILKWAGICAAAVVVGSPVVPAIGELAGAGGGPEKSAGGLLKGLLGGKKK